MEELKDIFTYIEKINLNSGSDILTVSEVLQLPELKKCKVIGGEEGLSNICKHMSVLETPEGISWSEGREFLLTAGYFVYKNEKAKENIFKEAFKYKVSAIAIKENRYFGEISKELIGEADKYKIPLIIIPYDVGYTDAISGFYNLLFYKKNKYILNLNNLYERLLDLAFENKDINGVVDFISNLLNSNVFLFDNKFNLISNNILDKERYKDLKQIIIHNRDTDTFKDDLEPLVNVRVEEFFMSVYSIIRTNKKVGFLYLIKKREFDLFEESAIQYGVSIISMKLEKQWLIKLSTNTFNKTLVEMMLNNKDLPNEFFDNVAKDLGWDVEGGLVGICIRINGDANLNYHDLKGMIYDRINSCLGFNNYLATERNNEIFLFLKLQENNYLEDVLNDLNECIDQIKDGLSISLGVSNIYDNLSHIEKLYNESYLAALFSPDRIIYYELLDTIKLLYPLKDDKEIQLYYENTIEKLSQYDLDNGMYLLKTLESYFENNLNKKKAATKLFIHVETLRYRLSRIEEITGFNVDDAEGIFALKMGLKLQIIMKLR